MQVNNLLIKQWYQNSDDVKIIYRRVINLLDCLPFSMSHKHNNLCIIENPIWQHCHVPYQPPNPPTSRASSIIFILRMHSECVDRPRRRRCICMCCRHRWTLAWLPTNQPTRLETIHPTTQSVRSSVSRLFAVQFSCAKRRTW